MDLDPWSHNDESIQRGKPLRARLRARDLDAERPRPVIHYHPPVPAAFQAEHERRIQAETERVQRELASRQHEAGDPVEAAEQRASRQRKTEQARRKLLGWLARHGGQQARKAIRAGLGWTWRTLGEAATGPWFTKTYYEVALSVAGWQAARQEGVSQ